ncbi:zinc finger protein GLIS2 homolog isoform X1 [Cydia pomonella]|uniref:zinc finger protein GLIS2 homolog isoform X1 n=1 Tax=Cydia pomonella TaxID=82600 RepID=UPI002ADE2C15|nr:zinc finger protein GLIS2 homolog isoform X1 [Cydia pomonella]
MLVFPQWRPEVAGEGCRVQRWMPADRFAPYIARPVMLPAVQTQIDEESSSGGSSPEREPQEVACGWRGCGAHFGSVARLSAHVARAHALAHRDGLFYCGWRDCTRPQRGFNARYKMLVHIRTHTNERPHTCNQCSKSFSRAENLKIHLRSHSGEKPYVCPYEGCGKAYSNSSDRFKHTRTHTVDKPYCCKVPGCNKRYTDPSSLRKHVKTYKHFTSKHTPEPHSPEASSPAKENSFSYNNIQSTSPMRIQYSPPRNTSPTIPPYNPILPMSDTIPTAPYPPILEPVYPRPLETMYPLRLPINEMSYVEYTQMYEHAYRSYYCNGVSYPVLRPAIGEKIYTYEEPRIEAFPKVMETAEVKSVSDMPLNLKCTKRESNPLDKKAPRLDLPLDLSNKR